RIESRGGDRVAGERRAGSRFVQVQWIENGAAAGKIAGPHGSVGNQREHCLALFSAAAFVGREEEGAVQGRGTADRSTELVLPQDGTLQPRILKKVARV